MGPDWATFTHKWTLCGHCVILGPGRVMLLYILQVVFWVELSIQRKLCPIFVKLWVPVKGTQQCGIGLLDIHKFPRVDSWSTELRVLGHHKLGNQLTY